MNLAQLVKYSSSAVMNLGALKEILGINIQKRLKRFIACCEEEGHPVLTKGNRSLISYCKLWH